MPIYEYECITNKHRFEVIQSYNDPIVTHCTVCGEPVQKLLSSPAIQFKGSGWYITDYARKGQSSESSETKTNESKPATKESKTEPAQTETPSASSKPSTETKP